jgi:hypothetical protein
VTGPGEPDSNPCQVTVSGLPSVTGYIGLAGAVDRPRVDDRQVCKTLSAKFIGDLLEVTGDGRAHDFETAAITRSSAFCAAKASAAPNCSAYCSVW